MKKWCLSILTVLLVMIGYHRNNASIPGRHDGGDVPRLFAKDVISTANDEFGATFTPDGNTCYFSMKSPSTISNSFLVICVSHFENGKWSEPDIAPFSGKYKDFNPMISPDGSQLFFISNRPVNGQRKFDTDIWVMKKSGDGWGEPENIGAPVNSAGLELGCSVTNDGTIYFSSTGTTGNPDIYCSRFKDDKYQTSEKLDTTVNSEASETDVFIAPDESYLLFASTGRADGLSEAGASAEYPRGDIYISYRKNGKWMQARPLGNGINSTAEESSPFVSRDGKTLYFSSERNFTSIPMKKKLDYATLENGLHGPGNGQSDIYAVSTSIFLNK